MRELAYDWKTLLQDKMRPTTRSQCRYTPRYRAILPTLLFLLCIPIFFYQLVPRFTHATDGIILSLTNGLHPQSTSTFCTKQVGTPHCCAVYLAAAPCLDECTKQHMDRVTFSITAQYDDCADECLVEYNGTCKKTGQSDASLASSQPGPRNS
jgi:hypothetical protein